MGDPSQGMKHTDKTLVALLTILGAMSEDLKHFRHFLSWHDLCVTA